MSGAAMIIGVLLAALGIGGYFGSPSHSLTALIPAAFGGVLFALGLAALKTSFRKHAMHAAALVALVGFFATISGLVALVSKFFEEPALLSKSAMAILCGAFVVLAVKSFIDARRNRKAGDAAG